jgi:hypothetical protein
MLFWLSSDAWHRTNDLSVGCLTMAMCQNKPFLTVGTTSDIVHLSGASHQTCLMHFVPVWNLSRVHRTQLSICPKVIYASVQWLLCSSYFDLFLRDPCIRFRSNFHGFNFAWSCRSSLSCVRCWSTSPLVNPHLQTIGLQNKHLLTH